MVAEIMFLYGRPLVEKLDSFDFVDGESIIS